MADNVEPIRRISNITRIEQLLENPSSDSSLETLREEMNELAHLRQNTRLAFCKRLALVWMIIVGQRPIRGKVQPKAKEFRQWCGKNIRSANGKRYSISTLRTYLGTGFAADPEAHLKGIMLIHRHRSEKLRRLAIGVVRAANKEEAPRAVPISTLKAKFNIPNDIASQVNALMRAWEQADPQARSQFIYQITGRKLP